MANQSLALELEMRLTITTHPDPVWGERANYAAFVWVGSPADGWCEQLALESCPAEGEAVVCCIPLVAYDVSLGDRVQLTLEPMGAFVTDVLERSSWYSYRVMPVGDTVPEHAVAHLSELADLHEHGGKRLIGLAVVGPERAQALVHALDQFEQEGFLHWESAQSAPSSQ